MVPQGMGDADRHRNVPLVKQFRPCRPQGGWSVTFSRPSPERPTPHNCIGLAHCSSRLEASRSKQVRVDSWLPSAASADMLVERFQGFTSEVLMHPVHELVGR